MALVPHEADDNIDFRDTSREASSRTRLVALLTLILAGVCAFFFSEGVPFFFEDMELIELSAAQTYAQIVAQILNPFPQAADFGFLDRPVEFLCLKLLRDAVGYVPWIFHAFKTFCALLVASLVSALLWKATRTALFPLLTGFWLVCATPVYISYLWVCDFEIVSQVFVVVSLGLWWMLLSNRLPTARRRFITGVAIVCLTYLGSKAKAGALVVPMAILLSSLPFGYGSIRRAVVISGLSVLVTIVPRIIVADQGIRESVAWHHIPQAFPQLIQTAGIIPTVLGLSLCVVLVIRFVCRRIAVARYSGSVAPPPQVGATMSAVLIAWIMSTVMLWTLLPHIETRYLAGAVIACLATIGFAGASVSALRRSSSLCRILTIVMAVSVVLQIVVNIWLDIHYRGYWGSHFIAINQMIDCADRHYRNAVILYRHNRRAFYSPTPSAGNSYVRLAAREMEKAGLKQLTDGTIVTPCKYTEVLLVGFMSPDPRVDTNRLCRLPGTAGTWFDSFVETMKVPIRSFNAMSLSTSPDKHAYPCVGYIGPVLAQYR